MLDARTANHSRQGGTMLQILETGAAVVTALVATVALTYAYRQVSEMRAARYEASKPYVVAYLEPHPADLSLVDLVVKNFGQTAAYDIRLKASPPLTTSINDGPHPLAIFDCLPVLVPGQSWTTLWDSGLTRKGDDYPLKHDVTVSYRGPTPEQKVEEIDSVLDWHPLMIRSAVVHDPAASIAKSVKSLSDTVQKIVSGGQLRVVADDAVHRRRVSRAHMERTGEPVTNFSDAEAAYEAEHRNNAPPP